MSTEYKLAVALLYVLIAVWMIARWRKWDRMYQILTPIVLGAVGGSAVYAILSIWMRR